MSESNTKSSRRWIGLGELIALAALIVSALGLWLTWKNSHQDKPTRIVEQRQPIPLTLRGRVQDDGRSLSISPVEDAHALQSLVISVPTSGSVIEVGSDGEVSARAIESAMNAVGDHDKGTHRLPVRISAKYVETGADKAATGAYVIRYRWEGGGLFGGRSLRIVGLSR